MYAIPQQSASTTIIEQKHFRTKNKTLLKNFAKLERASQFTDGPIAFPLEMGHDRAAGFHQV
jgi:hypothetical protein